MSGRGGRAAPGELTSSPLIERVRRFQNQHPLGRFVLPASLLVVFLGYPYYYDLPGIRTLTLDILGMKLDIVFVIAVYVMLALGLNIVVGFAGLLDLGYVAFYALGAYTVGWFASDHFAAVNGGEGIHVLAGQFASQMPGIHLNFLLIVVIAIVI